MPTSATKKPKTVHIDNLFELMDHWAKSWAGSEADYPVGEGLVAELRPFIRHLADSGLSPKTVRRHLDNTWVIGGETIREVVWEPRRRKIKARQLLLETVDNGDAPFVTDFSEQQQRSLDATAKKLFRFLKSSQEN